MNVYSKQEFEDLYALRFYLSVAYKRLMVGTLKYTCVLLILCADYMRQVIWHCKHAE